MYQFAAKLATLAENGQGYKTALYSSKNKNVRSVYFLVANATKKKYIIDKLLAEVGLLKEIKSQAWLSRVLVTELLWGRGHLPSSSPLFKLIGKSKDKLLEALPKIENENPKDSDESIPRYIRINTEDFTKDSAVAHLKGIGFEEVPCPETYDEFLQKIKSLNMNEFIFDFHVPYLIVFSKQAKIDKLSPVSFIRQDKSSCLVSLLLAPVPGTSILDMCAAPGYKTHHASSLIHKKGKIYSIEINKGRYQTLQKTCKDFKLESCVTPLNMDTLKTSDSICPDVEYIIVDPPCSGTGIVNLLVRHTADENRLRKLSNLQAMILKHGLRKFPLARRLVYSTCSVEEAENEGVVRECLDIAEENGWKLVPLSRAFHGSFSTGMGEHGSSVLRLSPERDLTNGFFLALFERSVPPLVCSQRDDFQSEVIKDSNTSLDQEGKTVINGSEGSKSVTLDKKKIDLKTVKENDRSKIRQKASSKKSKKLLNSITSSKKFLVTSDVKITKNSRRVRSKKLKKNVFHVKTL